MPVWILTVIQSVVWKIGGKLIKEVLLSILGRLKWSALVERLLSRVIASGLRWLAESDTNGLTGKTAADALAMIQHETLPELK